MSVMHICNIAECVAPDKMLPPVGKWQFRNHAAFPWCEEYGSLLEPDAFSAYVKLWLSAGKPEIRSRPIDAARFAYKIAYETPKPLTLRDSTPLAFITGPEVFTANEAEYYMRTKDREWWTDAARFAARMVLLIKKHK